MQDVRWLLDETSLDSKNLGKSLARQSVLLDIKKNTFQRHSNIPFKEIDQRDSNLCVLLSVADLIRDELLL